MTIKEHIGYWLKSANRDLEIAESLFDSGKYAWCLFIGHLVLEKVLKAIYVQNSNNRIPPKIHNLVKLAEIGRLQLTQEDKIFLDEVNDFNLEVRYPDYKQDFYELCTEEYTKKFFNKIKEFHQWLVYRIELEK